MAREERPQTSPIPARGLPTGTTPESAVDDDRTGEPGFAPARSSLSRMRVRPVSPNIQIYRPQLTSVLSIANRITGIALSVAAIGLVIWLTAAASGASAYGAVQNVLVSWVGQVFSVHLHLRLFPASLRWNPSPHLGHGAWSRSPIDLSWRLARCGRECDAHDCGVGR